MGASVFPDGFTGLFGFCVAVPVLVPVPDPIPVVTVVASTPDTMEGGSTDGVFTFSRTGSTASTLDFTYSIGGTAGPMLVSVLKP